MIAIVVSRADRASVHIGEQLLAQVAWTEHEDDSRADAEGGGTYYRHGAFELREFDDLHTQLTDADEAFSETPDLLVFVSRHAGDTGALLTGHFTGNFGAAEYGGNDHELAETAPSALSAYIGALAAHAPEGYDVAVEGTHHGPTDLACPSMFAELGSGDEQWDDPAGARAVGQAVLALTGVEPHRERQVVGFGGGHYAPRFGRIVRETPWAVGHIGIDWQLDELGEYESEQSKDVIRQAFEKSRSEYALVDGDNDALVDTITEMGYRVVSETWVREVGTRSLPLVEALEAALCSVDDGLRFGDAEPTGATDWEVVSLPDDLLAAVQGGSPDAAREAVLANTVAFEAEQSGTRARGRAAVVDASARSDLIRALAAILRESYDEVTVDDDAVVAREQAFDPEKARRLGISDGPEMGKLAGGQAVEVGGERIPPTAVQSEREVRFPL